MNPAAEPVDLNIIEAMDHERLFQPWFKGDSWDGWRAILKAAFCLPMTERECAFFNQVAERSTPKRRVRELIIVAGRRAGKDSIASLITAYAAVFFAARQRLRPGERALCACLACDRDQARIVLGYTKSYFERIAPLAGMVTRETVDGFELNNGVDIAISTNSFRNIRGRAILTAVLDECAFYRDETTSNADEELYRALVPGTVTLAGDAMIIGISTPYAKRGLLYRQFKAHYGKDGDDVLVIKAPSIALNPTLDRGIIDAALAEDVEAASSEWLPEWRSDVGAYISREAVSAVVVDGRFELPPMSGTAYTAMVDPSGGSADSMTLAIACRDREGRGVLVCLREQRPTFSPEACVADFARTLRAYRVDKVTGDRWGGEFVREPFRVHGIEYQIADRSKSDFYRDFLPLINSGRVELLDNTRMIAQLCGLERRVSRLGKDSIDHAPGAHDDLVNAAAGCLVLACGGGSDVLFGRGALGIPLPSLPVRPELVFGVLATNKFGEAGCCFFARTRVHGGVCLLDVELGQLAPAFLHGVAERCRELSEACGARYDPALFCAGAELIEALARLDCYAEDISGVVKDSTLALSAAAHISAGRVRLCADVLSRDVPLSFLSAGPVPATDSVLQISFLAGIAVSLDEGRRAAA
jgi:hypothetical protein